MPALNWDKLKEGVEVLRVWELEGKDAYPQLAVVRVSNVDYYEFSKDPKEFMSFVNAKKIFSKDVIFSGPWVTLSAIDQKADQLGWVLTLLHGKLSWMIVSALPRLLQEYGERKTK